MSDFEVSDAEIEYSEAPNPKTGRMTPCVIARCLESGEETEEIWGDEEASVKRALATLTEKCSCGANFHKDVDD